MIEVFNRTIKIKIFKEMMIQKSHCWSSLYVTVLKKYNECTIHSTIGMTPKDGSKKENEKFLLNSVFNYSKKRGDPTFKIGDFVRVSRIKSTFHKSYNFQYSFAIYSIYAINKKMPITYILKNYKDEIVQGRFYQTELIKCRYPDVYLVEKILQRKKGKILCKWYGFDESEATWEEAKSIL
jgi:hypothetical protein